MARAFFFLLLSCLSHTVLPGNLLLAAPDPAHALAQDPKAVYAPFPQPDSGYVTDLADLLTPSEEERIEQWLWKVEKQSRVEIIVVTINSIRDYPDTPNGRIETFATALFDAYGIGNLPENNGILLLVAAADRKARIELGGGYSPRRDQDAHHIMQEVIIPRFRDADYAGGIQAGVKAIVHEFTDLRIGWNWPLILLLMAVPVLGIIAFSLMLNGKKGWGWVVVGMLVLVVLIIVLMLVGMFRKSPGASSSWGAGGLGGFGGGFSGGGGASGSW